MMLSPPKTETSKTAGDPTFRSYSDAEAQTYASARLSYSPRLYDTILSYHTSASSSTANPISTFKSTPPSTTSLLLDVGCGPGNATRDLALSFDHAIGTDPGEAMIAAAKALGGKTKTGEQIDYVVSAAETISGIAGLVSEDGLGTVDLLSVAMAVHWFDMPRFWAEAAKVMKPGGTVALWTSASSYCHPSTPNAAKLQEILIHFERVVLAPYELPGNRLSRDMYDNLPLPWTVHPPVPEFPEADFVRLGYDRDGKLDDGKDFFGGGHVVTLEQVEKGLATASMVTRWRAAHPELVGTEEDCVKVFLKQIKETLGGQESVKQGSSTAILLFKRA